MSAIVYGMQKL